jgi:diguanylate cyclase (GGDEF)-like protein
VDALAPDPRRPRPVAGLPAADAHAVAKAWLLELVAGGSLEEAASLPTAELAAEGPGLAAAVLAALSDDTALRRLTPGGNLDWLSARTAELAGAAGVAGAVQACEALRRATLSSILAAGRIDGATAADLADRLAHVCSVLAEAAAAHAGGETPTPRAAEAEPAPIADPLAGPAEPIVRRADAGSWETAVERQLERHGQDASPFALLSVEVDELDRLRAADEKGEVEGLLEAVERALAAALRPADQLFRAEPGRYCVTAPDTGPAVGRVLAELLAESAGVAASHAGTPLTVSIGVATCPEDGQDVEALAGQADQAMFAARAAGTSVAPA